MGALLTLCLGAPPRAGSVGVRVCVVRVDVVAPYEAEAPLRGGRIRRGPWEGSEGVWEVATWGVLNEDGGPVCRGAVVFHLDGRGRRRRSGGRWC